MKMEAVEQAEKIFETEFYLEEIVLKRLKLEAEVAQTYAVELEKKLNKENWIKPRDVSHAKAVARWKLQVFEKEWERLHGDCHFNEEEELLAGLDGPQEGCVSPEDVEEGQSRYVGLNDPEDFHDPHPRTEDGGDEPDEDDAVLM